MLNIQKDYYLKELPFNIVPDSSMNIKWAGMNNLKNQFHKNIQKSIINSSSKILINYGHYGSGKTHSALYFSSNQNFNFIKDNNVISIKFDFPKNSKNMTEYLFHSFLGKYGVKTLIEDLLKLQEEENLELLLKQFNDDEEIRNIILQILKKQNLLDNDINDIKEILYNRADNKVLKKYHILKKVDNDNIMKVFSIILKLLTHKKYDLIIFWIDEFEDITTLNRQEVNKIISFLRDLINYIPQKILTYLNFVPTAFTNLDSLYSYFIGSSLDRRIQNGVEFKPLNLEDIKIYIKELFKIYRTEDFNKPNKYFPLKENVVEAIYNSVNSDLTIGKFNNILQELFEDAIIANIKIIDLEYFNTIKNEIYSIR